MEKTLSKQSVGKVEKSLPKRNTEQVENSSPKRNTDQVENSSPKRNTIQKEAIGNIVLSACDHPTAEMIFERARVVLPKISLGTVYRILTGFVEDGSVREIMVPQAPVRFDKTTRIHSHFVCRLCKAVTDIKLDEDNIIKEAITNNSNQIDEAEIIFRGICQNCNEKLQ